MNPVSLGYGGAGWRVNDIAGRDGYGFTCGDYPGLVTYNRSQGYYLNQLGICYVPGSIYKTCIYGNYAFTIAPLFQIDISDPLHPQFINQCWDPILTFASLYADSSYIYAVQVNYAPYENQILFYLYDVHNYSDTTYIGARGFLPYMPYDICASGNFVYIADSTAGIEMIDISTPTYPTIVSNYSSGGIARCIKIIGHYAYISDAGFHIVDISNPPNLVSIGDIGYLPDAIGLFIDGNYAYYCTEHFGFTIINISNPNSPEVVGGYVSRPGNTGICALGSYVYLARGDSGIDVIDISNKENPVFSSHFDTPGTVNDLQVYDSTIVVSDIYSLMLLKPSNSSAINPDDKIPTKFDLLQNYPNPFNGTTSIDFAIARDGHVNLSAYNIMGQKVATLRDEFEKAGDERVNWEASSLPSGVYFARLDAAGRVMYIKMVLLK